MLANTNGSKTFQSRCFQTPYKLSSRNVSTIGTEGAPTQAPTLEGAPNFQNLHKMWFFGVMKMRTQAVGAPKYWSPRGTSHPSYAPSLFTPLLLFFFFLIDNIAMLVILILHRAATGGRFKNSPTSPWLFNHLTEIFSRQNNAWQKMTPRCVLTQWKKKSLSNVKKQSSTTLSMTVTSWCLQQI